jgi:hypothetical protein
MSAMIGNNQKIPCNPRPTIGYGKRALGIRKVLGLTPNKKINEMTPREIENFRMIYSEEKFIEKLKIEVLFKFTDKVYDNDTSSNNTIIQTNKSQNYLSEPDNELTDKESNYSETNDDEDNEDDSLYRLFIVQPPNHSNHESINIDKDFNGIDTLNKSSIISFDKKDINNLLNDSIDEINKKKIEYSNIYKYIENNKIMNLLLFSLIISIFIAYVYN